MPSISHLIPRGMCSRSTDERLVSHYLLRPNLEAISVGAALPVSRDLVKQIQSNNAPSAMFPRMRCVEVEAEEETLQLILPVLEYLQHIKISILHGDSQPQCRILDSLCSSRLESVKLERSPIIHNKALLPLVSRCRLMWQFVVGQGSCGFNDDFTDERLDQIASIWKHLEVLALYFPVALSINSLISLSRHCPRHCQLTLLAHVELDQLNGQPEEIHFACLVSLEVRDITYRNFDYPQDACDLSNRMIPLFQSRFPLLYWFGLRYSHSYRNRLTLRQSISHFLYKTRRHGYIYQSSPPVSHMLAKRLIHPEPGNRYNPLS